MIVVRRIVLLCLLLPALEVVSQSLPPKNALSLEVGKNGLLYQLSFDHRFPGKDFGYRLSAGSNFGRYLRAYTAAGGGYFLIGKRKGSLELGADLNYLNVEEISDDQRGLVLISPDYTTQGWAGNLLFGFRATGQRTLFRAGYAPMWYRQKMIQGAYLSFGFRF